MQTDTQLTPKLPEGYSFADLNIRRCEADAIDLDMDLVKLVCNINGTVTKNSQSGRCVKPRSRSLSLTYL